MLNIADFQGNRFRASPTQGNLKVFVKFSNFERFLYYLVHSSGQTKSNSPRLKDLDKTNNFDNRTIGFVQEVRVP